MTCNEAAEYVSALCDGVVIPPSAAEHMGMCPVCQERLRSYIEMGVEMRREACLHFARAKEPTAFKRDRRTMARLWQSGCAIKGECRCPATHPRIGGDGVCPANQ
jgi:hypothetical protein